MSTHTLIRTGFIATLGVSALSVSAFTNAQNSSRYGNVGTYESGHCTQPCAAPVQQAPILVPQQAAPAVVYTQPAPVYGQQPVHAQQTAPIYSQPSQVLPGTCPVGTTAQPNGTCLQPSTVTGSYSAGPAFTTPSYAAPELSYSNSYAQAAPIDCPAGTTAQADGTCLQSGSASYGSATSSTSSTSTTYGSGTPQYSGQYSGETAPCPAGSTAQPDGTCLQTGELGVNTTSSYGSDNAYQGASVDLYTGDAAATTQTNGYANTNTYSSTSDYLPVRK